MSDPIKGCPQPDPPELVMRADGYHYRTEDEMRELTDEQIDEIVDLPECTSDGGGWGPKLSYLKFARAAIAADRALNAADRDVMRQTVDDIDALLYQCDRGNVSLPWLIAAVRGLQDRIAPATPPAEQHPDDAAVDQFATTMKLKLERKRLQGYGGWDDPHECPVEQLEHLLHEHVAKGDVVDIANFCMMLHARTAPGYRLSPAEQQGEPDYPAGEVAGACVCGGWPGGECLKCPKVEQQGEQEPAAPSLAALRAKAEALSRLFHKDESWIRLKDVLAEIDKLGGGAS